MDRKLTLFHCVACHLLWHELIQDHHVGPIPNTNMETTKAQVQSKREDPLESLCGECKDKGYQIIESVNADSSQ